MTAWAWGTQAQLVENGASCHQQLGQSSPPVLIWDMGTATHPHSQPHLKLVYGEARPWAEPNSESDRCLHSRRAAHLLPRLTSRMFNGLSSLTHLLSICASVSPFTWGKKELTHTML